MATVEMDQLNKVYENGFHAVKDLSIDVNDGEFLVLVGPSGCGKTTALRLLAGLEEISEGRILIGDRLVNDVAPKDRDIAMVFQSYALYPHMTVFDNMAFGLKLRKTPKDEIKRRVQEAAEILGIEGLLDRKPRQLSGGQKQRVGIARAFGGDATVVVADEPVSALDVSVQAAVTQLLMEIQRENRTTLLFISHDLSLVRYLADRVVVMYLGTIAEQGTTDEVFSPPYHPYTEALLSAIPIADTSVKKKHIVLEGDIPSAMNPPPGCPFQTRCPRKLGNICEEQAPPIRVFGQGHKIACHIPPADLLRMEPVIVMGDRAAAAE
jgi:peptide/nickel transport system ATP-binding protein